MDRLPQGPSFGVGRVDGRGPWSRHRQYPRICRDGEVSAWERAFAEPATTEIGTTGYDPDRVGVGSSPYRGDVSNSALFVPEAPTRAPELRYLMRGASVAVPAGSYYLLRGIRTAVTIGGLLFDPSSGGFLPIEMVVESRFWSFTNGNVAYFVMVEHGAPRQEGGEGEGRFPRSLPSMTPELYGTDPALTYAVNAAGVAEDGIVLPYRPPSGGVPPGTEVPGLGIIRDSRFGHPQHGALEDFEFAIPGPCRVTGWISIYQTDPRTRSQLPVVLPPGATLEGFPREDVFVRNLALLGGVARYRHAAMSLIGSLAPYNTAPDSVPDFGQGGCGT
jgi:hypothetical protein